MRFYGEVRIIQRVAVNTYLIKYFDCQALHRINQEAPKLMHQKQVFQNSVDLIPFFESVHTFSRQNCLFIYYHLINPFKLKQAASISGNNDKENKLLSR